MAIVVGETSSTPVIVTEQVQGPSGALASPTGTGLVLALAGAIVGAALAGSAVGQVPVWNGTQWEADAITAGILTPGTARQVLVTNASGTAAIWGSVLLSNSSAVQGILALANGGTGLSASGSDGNVLTSDGTTWVSQAPAAGGITTLTQDVTAGPGSGSVAATVVGAQAGLLAFAATTGLVTWATGATGPGLTQASESATQTPTAFVITPQVSTHATNQDGSLLNIALSSALGGGADARLLVTRGGSNSFQVGGDANGHTALWLDTASPSYMNADLRKVGSDLWFVPPGNLRFTPTQSNVAIFNGGSGEASFGFNVAIGAFTGGAYGGGAGACFSIAKAGTNPSSSISTGGVIYADSTSGALCLYPAGVTAPALTAGNGTVYTAAILQVGTTLAVNGAPTGPGGGGVGVIAMNAATTLPTPASVTGGLSLAASSGKLVVYDASATAMTVSGGGFAWTGGVGGSIAINNAAWALSLTPSALTTATGMSLSAGSTSGATGGYMTLTAGAGATTGGAASLVSGAGAATANGTLTLSTGTSTVYNASGGLSSGNTPGAWNLNGPAFTVTQLATTIGKSTLAATACYAFVPVTFNGVTCQLIVTF